MTHARAAERRFYLSFVLVIFGAVLLGFGRTFFLRPWFPEWVALHAPREPFYLLHGAATAAWFVVLIFQVSLVKAARLDLHRRLGTTFMGLAAAVFVLGVAGALIGAGRPTGFIDVDIPPRVFLLNLLVNMLVFAIFVSLGYLQRRNPQAHKRLMLLAAISMVSAAIIRWPFEWIGMTPLPGIAMPDVLTFVFLLPMAAWDLASGGRIHPITLFGGLAILLMNPFTALLWQSSAWLAIADRLV